MIAADDDKFVPTKRRNVMKKLMTLMLGLCLAFGTVAVTFAQETPKKDSKDKKGSKKGSKKKKEAMPKKDGVK
jgi:hypothetical protein